MDKQQLPDFESLGEADVREDILAPLIASLNYSNLEGGLTRIQREHRLVYPALFLGRKKPGKDPALVGIADYTLQVIGHANWTLEAKAPDVSLDEDVVQQAWSYAAHPEVRGVYFMISNGREFQVHLTSAPPSAPPLLTWRFEETQARFGEIEALLSPQAVARRFPDHFLRMGQPLGPGLTAIEHVASGTISYKTSSLDLPLLRQMQVAVKGGVLFRDGEGRICANLKTVAPLRDLNATVQAMGLDEQHYVSDAETLSVDRCRPTKLVFEYERDWSVGLDHVTLATVEIPGPKRVRVNATADCVLSGSSLSGPFVLRTEFETPNGIFSAIADGDFALRLG